MGVVERMHHHIVNMGLAMMHHASLSLRFWNFTFFIVAFLYNWMTTLALNRDSPYWCLFRENPNLEGLWVFGCLAYLNLCPHNPNKFGYRTDPHIFIGYPRDYRLYMCYNPKSKKILISRDIMFLDHDNTASGSSSSPSNSYHAHRFLEYLHTPLMIVRFLL